MAFKAKISSWRFRHLNIVGCLLKRRPTKKGARTPQDPPSYATEFLYARLNCNLQLYSFPSTCLDFNLIAWSDHLSISALDPTLLSGMGIS